LCPKASGAEAAWAGEEVDVLAHLSLIQLINHVKGTQVLSRPKPKLDEAVASLPDLADIKGQESTKRALEVAAAGGHHLLMLWTISGSYSPVNSLSFLQNRRNIHYQTNCGHCSA
jgi:magnesium chelatase family protein